MGMVDIGRKKASLREAVVEGKVLLSPQVLAAIKKKSVAKGDVLEVAKLAGIMAVKKTPELIPLCHPIPIEYADIKFSVGKEGIKVRTTVKAEAKTGVEMEALMACVVSCLTIYDMCKTIDREITISDIRLLKKSGGKSGNYIRD